VQGFGRRPAHISNTRHACRPAFESYEGTKPRGRVSPVSRRYGNLAGAAGAAVVLRDERRSRLLREDTAVGWAGA
jgi:hypothetical protein